MRQPSIVIHKGGKEERYIIYVEDYVISFLKEKSAAMDTSGILFYGCREKEGKQYTIYGAGVDMRPAVFDKYELLEEVSCRLTQNDPVFLIKEANGTYEVKGYKVFYYENEEMQDYLIHQDMQKKRQYSFRDRSSMSGQNMHSHGLNPIFGQLVRGKKRYTIERDGRIPTHYAISLQLGVVFVVLTAIVVNSANSYDKMRQLNQSATEVFFVMENQETETESESGQSDISVERDETKDGAAQEITLPDSILQDSVLQENRMQEQSKDHSETEGDGMSDRMEDTADDGEGVQTGTEQMKNTENDQEVTDEPENTAESQKDGNEPESESDLTQKSEESNREDDAETDGQTDTQEQEGVEALSRNVARYYKVERGDTLYRISQKIYGDTSHVQKICEVNQITNPDNIRYGQKIILP